MRERIGSPNSEEQSDDVEIDRELENLSAQLERMRAVGENERFREDVEGEEEGCGGEMVRMVGGY